MIFGGPTTSLEANQALAPLAFGKMVDMEGCCWILLYYVINTVVLGEKGKETLGLVEMLIESWHSDASSERRTCSWGQLSKQNAIWFLAVGPEMTANCFALGQTFERLPHYLSNKGVKKSELDKNSKAWIRKWLANEEQRFTVALACLVLPGGSCTVWMCLLSWGGEDT